MIKKYKEHTPMIHPSCFVAENASIIGNISIGEESSVWFHTVIRGDCDHIRIGKCSNIQDNCTLHTDAGHSLTIGDYVSVGHNVVLHGAHVEDKCLIGMGAIILNGAYIGAHSIIGAGALVVEGQIIPEYSVAVGSPARVIKQIRDEQMKDILENAQHYAKLGNDYKGM